MNSPATESRPATKTLNSANCYHSLLQNIEESVHYALDLRQLLDDERQALQAQDSSLLNETAVSKQVCVAKLEELDSRRQKISRECGFADDITKLFDWCKDTNTLATAWTKFLEIVAVCNDMNSGNGAVIRVRQVQINDAIGLLREGQTSVDTYGPTGQNNGEFSSRSLAEA